MRRRGRPPQLDLIEKANADARDEPLAAPSPPAQRAMARHLADEHEYSGFRLKRDLYLGCGSRLPAQILTWDPGQARFWCARCPGEVFWTGEITETMIRHAQLWDKGLRPHLAGLHTQEQRDRMTRRYLSGELNREQLRNLEKAGPRRRAAVGKRPEVEERRGRVQAWMLERIRVHGVLERVLEEAEEMQRENPDEWLRLAHRELRRPTLVRYWYDIDPSKREEARAAAQRGAPPPQGGRS